MKLEDILNSDYLETDTPEGLITENQNIKEITNYIVSQLEEKEVLKKNFNRKDFVYDMCGDFTLIDKVKEISEDLLQHMIRHYRNLEVVESNNISSMDDISDLWKFTKEEALQLDKENRQYYLKYIY